MSTTTPDQSETSYPQFNLTLKDIDNVEYQTLTEGNDDEHPLRLDEGSTAIFLTIDNGSPPIGSHKFPEQKTSGNICNKSNRKFDSQKSNDINEVLIPLDDIAEDYKSSAGTASRETYFVETDKKLVISNRQLYPGNWRYTLVGDIDFKYVDDNGSIQGSEKLTVNLHFWINVTPNLRKFTLSRYQLDNSDAYYVESELNQPSQSN
jgi:hypothetical protein